MKHTKGERIANHIYKIDCTCTICNYLRIKINAELLEALKQLLNASKRDDVLTRHILNAEQAIAKAG